MKKSLDSFLLCVPQASRPRRCWKFFGAGSRTAAGAIRSRFRHIAPFSFLSRSDRAVCGGAKRRAGAALSRAFAAESLRLQHLSRELIVMAESFRLKENSYGKQGVRLVKVERHGAFDMIRQMEVEVRLEGDFAAAYEHGDNRLVVPTDTMKNTVYAMAGRGPVGEGPGGGAAGGGAGGRRRGGGGRVGTVGRGGASVANRARPGCNCHSFYY